MTNDRRVTVRIDASLCQLAEDMASIERVPFKRFCERALQHECDRLLATDPALTGLLEAMAKARKALKVEP